MPGGQRRALLLLLLLGVVVALGTPGFSNKRYALVVTKLQEVARANTTSTIDELHKLLAEGETVVDQLRFGPESHLSVRMEQAESLDEALIRVREMLTEHKIQMPNPEAMLESRLETTKSNNLELRRMNHELHDALGLQQEEIDKKANMRQELRQLTRKIRLLAHAISRKRRILQRAFTGENPSDYTTKRKVRMLQRSRVASTTRAQIKQQVEHKKEAKRKQAELDLKIANCHAIECVLEAKLSFARDVRASLKAQNAELVKAVGRATGIAKENVGATISAMSKNYESMTNDEKLIDSEIRQQIDQNKNDAQMQQRMRVESEGRAMLNLAP